MKAGVVLLSDQSGTGSDFNWEGGASVFVADASDTTFSGGSVKLQIKLQTGTYANITNGSLSAAGVTAVLYLPSGTYRAVTSVATHANASLCRVLE
jgi:hypothetical protein